MKTSKSHPMRNGLVHVVLRTIALLTLLAVPLASYGQSKVYVVNSAAVSLSVIDAGTNQVTATLPGPAALTAIAYNSGNGLLYVPTAEQIGNLFLLDPATNTFLPNPAALGAVPTYITVSPELNRAYVSNFFGGLSVIDTTSGGVITEVMGLASPIGTAVDAQLTKLYVINNLINTVSAIDTNTNQITNSVAFSCTEQDVKIDTLLHKAFVANGSCSELAVLDVATDALTAKIPLPGRPQFLTIDSQAHRAYVTYNNGIIGEQGMIGGLAIVDTSTNQVITSLVLGKDPTRLALNAAEGRLYVVDRFRNSVFVIDTASAAIVTEIPVGITPSDVAVVTPPAAKLSVTPATVSFGEYRLSSKAVARVTGLNVEPTKRPLLGTIGPIVARSSPRKSRPVPLTIAGTAPVRGSMTVIAAWNVGANRPTVLSTAACAFACSSGW